MRRTCYRSQTPSVISVLSTPKPPSEVRFTGYSEFGGNDM